MLSGTLLSYEIEGDKLSFIIRDKEKVKGTYYFKTEREKNKFLDVNIGSKIKIYGVIQKPNGASIPNNFDYKKYLYYERIFYLFKASKIVIINNKTNIFYAVKNEVIRRIRKIDDTGYLMTFIIGDKSLIDENTFDNYKKNGVTHLFAISGMHIGLFSLIILSLLKKIKIEEDRRYILTIIFIWFYAFLTGFSPSVLRSGLLFTLVSLNKIFYTEIKSINLLLLTGVILVIVNPFMLMNIGFIYSFLSTFGLIYGNNFISKHKVLGTSITASLFTIPVSINNFYIFNPLSFLLNLIFVPLVSSVIYPMSLIVFLVPILNPIFKILIHILEFLNDICSNTYIFKVICPKMNILLVIIYYIVLILYLNRNIKKCLVITFLIIFLNGLLPTLDMNTYIEFLDVGQGDSILIRNNKRSILIDTGGKLAYKTEKWKRKSSYYISNGTITYLHSLGIKKLDYMILTHGDADHLGEALNIESNIKIDNVVFNCGKHNNLERRLIQKLEKDNIPYKSCIDKIEMDKDTLYFLNTKDFGNENDNSNVIYTEIKGVKLMLMGDASKKTEESIIERYVLPKIDILKVGHHGSKTSSCKKFIDEVRPTYSIISVGLNNKYNHPNKEALDNLKNTKIYRTDRMGTIRIRLDDLKFTTIKS